MVMIYILKVKTGLKAVFHPMSGALAGQRKTRPRMNAFADPVT